MNPNEFLINRLKELFSRFDGIQIRYENRKSTDSHIIEVIPLSFFNENEDYMLEEEKLEAEFELLYPNRNIVFVSEDSLTKINYPDFKLGYERMVISCQFGDIEFEVSSDYSMPIYAGNKQNYALAA